MVHIRTIAGQTERPEQKPIKNKPEKVPIRKNKNQTKRVSGHPDVRAFLYVSSVFYEAALLSFRRASFLNRSGWASKDRGGHPLKYYCGFFCSAFINILPDAPRSTAWDLAESA